MRIAMSVAAAKAVSCSLCVVKYAYVLFWLLFASILDVQSKFSLLYVFLPAHTDTREVRLVVNI